MRAGLRGYRVRLARRVERLGITPQCEAQAELQGRCLGLALEGFDLLAQLDVLYESRHGVARWEEATTATALAGFRHVHVVGVFDTDRLLLQKFKCAHAMLRLVDVLFLVHACAGFRCSREGDVRDVVAQLFRHVLRRVFHDGLNHQGDFPVHVFVAV